MTIGISKEELRRLRDHYFSLGINPVIDINNLIEQCKELNQWLPIDENAPRDRFILCWIDDLQKKYILKFSTIRNTWLDQGLRTFTEPDLYQELPDDPVIPIHKPEPPQDEI